MFEIFLTILLVPLLEIIASIITYKLDEKIKWKPFEKHYNESLSNNNKTFTMIREPNSTAVLWVTIVIFSILWVLGSITTIILVNSQQVNIITGILMIILYSAICFPFISICLHCTTKKIYITEEQIFIKSLFMKKKYYIKDITKINEKSKQINKYLKTYTLEIDFNNKKIKIKNYYSNYDLLKNLLI